MFALQASSRSALQVLNSLSRRKGQAKHRRRRVPKLTPEERIALEVSRRAAENRTLARAEAARRRILEAMVDEVTPPQCVASDLDHWERCELERLNANRPQPCYVLPGAAYEAVRLMRYADV